MAVLIEFATSKFDVAAEPPNPFNPIPGRSFLEWLAPRLRESGFGVTEPDAEDWGWYVDVSAGESRYMIGAAVVSEEDQAGPDEDWIVQIDGHRKLLERLLGKGKLTGDDRLCRLVEQIVRSEPAFRGVTTTLEA